MYEALRVVCDHEALDLVQQQQAEIARLRTELHAANMSWIADMSRISDEKTALRHEIIRLEARDFQTGREMLGYPIRVTRDGASPLQHPTKILSCPHLYDSI